MVSVCLPTDGLSQRLLSYLGFSYLGHGVSHLSCRSCATQSLLQQYLNHELPDVQASFRKGRGMRHQISNIHWIIEKAREFHKNIYFCFIDYAKAFDYVDHNKLENS